MTDEQEETTECPLVYSGKGGVCNCGFQFSSIYKLIYVSGRITLVLNFSSQQLIKLSKIPIDVFVLAKTAVSKSALDFFSAILAILIQWASGVFFFLANII